MKGLFSLDVNNDIWEDIGLIDDEFNGDVPPWLGNETVQNGIRLMQDITNCQAELEICSRERRSLHHWFDEESATVMTVFQSCAGMTIFLFSFNYSPNDCFQP